MTFAKKFYATLMSYNTKNDPFDEEEHNIADYYFNYSDYEILFPRNEKRSDTAIMNQRKVLQNKLLNIDKLIYSRVKQFNLNHHWRPENITSLIRPCDYNKGKVGWMCIRYGKTKYEVLELNKGVLSKDEEFGFQKHACLQFIIYKDGFDISLFHAVPHDAIDRSYVHGKVLDNSFKRKLINEIKSLKGNEFVWHITDSNTDERYAYNIDDENPKYFIDFYNEYDMDGKESFLAFSLTPDDKKLKTINSLSKLILNKFSMLLPLYSLIAYRPPQI